LSDRPKLATRASRLALAQAQLVADALGGAELVPVRSGDGEPGDKGRFVRGVERAVLDGDADLGVHSAKDLPGQRPPELRLVGVPVREEPADAFVGGASSLDDLPAGARIGTSSLRRRAQLLALRGDLEVVDLRGNVDTRLRKLADGGLDGIVLAAAGLRRLGREAEVSFTFGLEELTPAGGQGALALEARRADAAAAREAARVTDPDALVEVTAERAAVAALDATCHTPVGVCARLDGDELSIVGFAGLPDGSEWVRDRVAGDAEQPAALGESLAERMLAAGTREVLDRAASFATADVIVHDRLIPRGSLDGARADAELIYAGKRPGAVDTIQAEIERLIVARARSGRSVVRLKGGDPFVFGRGGEEAEALAAVGVPFEVVPGVTAGVAAPAYAGIPLTHREDASAVALVTGHEDPAKDDTALDWEALARFPGTLVLYMGVKRLPEVVQRLIASGRDPGEPAVAVERGTTPAQRTVAATLAELPDAIAKADVRPPAVVVAGPVAARRETISWLERRPLHGLRVVVTRARPQAGGLAATLVALGAEAIELPAIRIVPRVDSPEVRDAVQAIHAYALVCLTSPNGVRLLFEALRGAGLDARALANATIAAIGPGTSAALAEHGIRADVVPERSVAEALVEALAGFEVAERPVLLARAADARDVLPKSLRARGAKLDVVALYETVAEEPDPAELEAAADADYVTFTSSSTVRSFVQAVGDRFPRRARIVSIGPVTSEAVRGAGLTVHVESERHDPEGLVEALLEDAGERQRSATVPG
jgi:uroporphyrinogen III methyltransferase/synthase